VSAPYSQELQQAHAGKTYSLEQMVLQGMVIQVQAACHHVAEVEAHRSLRYQDLQKGADLLQASNEHHKAKSIDLSAA